MPDQLATMEGRIVEHGHIRLGEKGGKGEPRKLTKFRFTSPDEQAIRELAALYGGTPKPWNDTRANPPNQWQVYSDVSAIDVLLLPNGLTIWYELWSGGGLQRRCDGEQCELSDGEGTTDCLCARKGQLECKETTRLRVIIPSIRFGGIWRLESKGVNAAHELTGMEEMLFNLQAALASAGQKPQPMLVEMYISERKRTQDGKTREYVVPGVRPKHTIQEILTGQANVQAIASASRLALPTATHEAPKALGSPDDEVIEAELVDGDHIPEKATEKDVESILNELKAITDKEARIAIKQEFVQRFGQPKDLPAAMVDDACAWIADRLGSVAS